ncbi:UBP1-associated protein 2A [Forsythia ovata]|uniref:UBP1-associated protein 2A n=1 Tax=Forsythia ovata TaxID=205694 RepID=A0ABD1T335_9LAMI
MARKRKTRASEASQQPEPVQPLEPETEPEPELDPETEQPDPMETQEEEPEEEEEELEEQEEEEEEHRENVIDESKNDTVSEDVENDVQGNEITEKPSEDAVLQENDEGKNEEEEEEEELEEEALEKLLEPFSKDQLSLLIKEAVVKHSDLLENVQKLADVDPMHRKIFVHGLGWDANDEIMKSVFGKYGEIEDCKVVSDKNSGKSKGYGFILYKHREGARRALKQPQKTIGNRTASCQLASTGPVQALPSVATVSAPPMSEYTQRKIYVSNVSAEIDIKKLVEFFSKFGEIEEGPLGLDKLTGKPRGFCLFVYKNLESAKKALEEPHKNFEGHMLHCQKAIDGPKPTKGYYNQQHQQKQHHQGQQGYYHPSSKKGKYAGNSGGVGHTGGHLMAPSAGPTMPSMGLNPAVAPAALGQAVAALLASQGAGLSIGNLLGGIGAGGNQQGVPMMSNVGYRAQGGAGGYGSQPGMQGGYGPGGTRPQQGGAPYMGHGH